jgi:predicted metal-binding membrane protein
MSEVHEPVERWLYGGALLGLIGGAWIAMGLLGESAYAPYFSHDFAGIGVPWPVGARLAVFVAGWTLMSVAMMLPSSLPLVTGFHTMTRRASLVSLLIAGYLCVWALFGIAVFFADAVLHELIEVTPGLQERSDLVPAGLLLVAGLFQFSPLKYACLKQCRSPLGFLIQHWRGGHRSFRAFTVGIEHGMFCVGCCWGLMLLMAGVGGIHLGWMLVLGAIMFIEKAVTWGRWITMPVGGIFALWGLGLLLRIPGVPLPF